MITNEEQKKQRVWVRSKGFMKKIKKCILKYRVIISVFASLFSILLLLLLLLLQCHSCILKNNKNLYWFLIAVVGLSAFFLFLWFFFRIQDKKESIGKELGKWILEHRKTSLFVAGLFSILLLLLLLLLQCSFCILEGNKILDYFLTAVVGTPVFFLLWFFRTSDTGESIEKAKENIEKAKENIKQTKLFNYLENLASSEIIKVDLGVTQLIKLSEQDSSFNEEIKLAFMKRLDYPPPIDKTKQNKPHLSYGQEIIKWLVEKEYKDLSFTNLNLDYQSFDHDYIHYEVGDIYENYLRKFIDTVQEYKKNYKNKRGIEIKISLKRAYLRYVILKKADLSGADLSGANLVQTTLFSIILTKSNLENADLREAFITNSILHHANLKKANLIGARLSKLDLRGANLEEVILKEEDLKEKNIQNKEFTPIISSKSEKLIGKVLQRSIYSRETKFPPSFNPNQEGMICIGEREKEKIEEINLENSDLSSMDLFRADLRKANLKGANLRKAHLKGANLREAKLEGAKLEGAIYNIRIINGIETKFPSNFDPNEAGMICIGEKEKIEEINLENADLRKANLRNASLEGTNLRHANLEGADLRHANLEGADLRHANLEGADLRHVNLEGTDLKKAKLKRVIYNNETNFPQGFDKPTDMKKKK